MSHNSYRIDRSIGRFPIHNIRDNIHRRFYHYENAPMGESVFVFVVARYAAYERDIVGGIRSSSRFRNGTKIDFSVPGNAIKRQILLQFDQKINVLSSDTKYISALLSAQLSYRIAPIFITSALGVTNDRNVLHPYENTRSI